ncbi:MAG TPA: tyrosine-type recombinase/integrase [Planctomycetaceae bacterium]|nr:tyrosine-type recombinase/integrase [Planctomycetaceae bacterium]
MPVRPKTVADRPQKPSAEFPLFPHQTRRWAKKIRGRTHYFGPWNDPDAALAKYLSQRDDLHAGRKPRTPIGELSVEHLTQRFLASKQSYVETGEMSLRTLRDYRATCAQIVEHFGRHRLVSDLHPDDFEPLRAALAATRGPVSLGNAIQRVRTLFAYAYDQGLLERPIRYGSGFDKPSRKTLRLHRQRQQATRGRRMFEAAELRTLLVAARSPLKAMLLLAINCGYGQSDIAGLPMSAIDLKAGWIDFPRPKTGIERRCPLWPETVAAVRDVLSHRRHAADSADEDLMFLTRFGRRWVRCNANGNPDDAVAKAFAKLLSTTGLKRDGLNFYALRHTFETVAGESLDQVAVDALMGHARENMASAYRERISDGRLMAVVNQIREWLFGTAIKNAA